MWWDFVHLIEKNYAFHGFKMKCSIFKKKTVQLENKKINNAKGILYFTWIYSSNRIRQWIIYVQQKNLVRIESITAFKSKSPFQTKAVESGPFLPGGEVSTCVWASRFLHLENSKRSDPFFFLTIRSKPTLSPISIKWVRIWNKWDRVPLFANFVWNCRKFVECTLNLKLDLYFKIFFAINNGHI